MNKYMAPFKNYKTYIILSMLIVIWVVLDRQVPGIKTPMTKITFSFLAVLVAGFYAGPIGGLIVAGCGDFIGAIMFPFGPYFFGYTLTAILSGAITGFFLYKNNSIFRILIVALITEILCSLLINTYWISFQSGKAYIGFLPTRIMQAGVYLIAKTTIGWPILKGLSKIHTKNFL